MKIILGSRTHRYDENNVHCTYSVKSRRKKERVMGKEGRVKGKFTWRTVSIHLAGRVDWAVWPFF